MFQDRIEISPAPRLEDAASMTFDPASLGVFLYHTEVAVRASVPKHNLNPVALMIGKTIFRDLHFMIGRSACCHGIVEPFPFCIVVDPDFTH